MLRIWMLDHLGSYDEIFPWWNLHMIIVIRRVSREKMLDTSLLVLNGEHILVGLELLRQTIENIWQILN